MNNVLFDLFRARFITSDVLLEQMHRQIEDMRAANVWGLPSLPMPYTMVIILMVKMHLIAMAMNNAAEFNLGKHPLTLWCWIGAHLNLVLSNLLYQGLLDLHGHLYSPNSGDHLGHLPSVNFLDFVKTVSGDLLEKNRALPYNLELGATDSEVGNSFSVPCIS